MKISPIAIFVIIILIVGMFFLGRISKKSENLSQPYPKEKIDSLQKNISQLNRNNDELTSRVTDQENLIENYKEKIALIDEKKHQAHIDSSVAKDSSNSIKEYRTQLSKLGKSISDAPLLTFGEITDGAKQLSIIPGLRLRIDMADTLRNQYEKKMDLQRQVITNLGLTITNLKSLNEGIQTNSNYYKDRYNSISWWDNFPIGFATSTIIILAIIIFSPKL